MSRLTFNPLSEQVTVGGNTLTVTALPLGTLRRVVTPMAEMPAPATAGAALDPALLDTVLKCVHQSLSNADPDITVEDLEACFTLQDLLILFHAVVSVSGLAGGGLGEGQSPESRNAIGSGSTGASSRPQAGRTAMSTGNSPTPKQSTSSTAGRRQTKTAAGRGRRGNPKAKS